MAFMDKVMFWKKKDDFDLGKFGADSGLSGGPNLGLAPDAGGADLGLPNQNLGAPEAQFGQQMPASQFGQAPSQSYPATAPPGFQQNIPLTPQTPPQQDFVGKDIEVISAKIDSLRAYLESINQRLANIERIAMHDQKKGW